MTKNYWENRHKPERKETMVGASLVRKLCHCCKNYKQTEGSKNIDLGFRVKAFVCADCVAEGKHKCIK